MCARRPTSAMPKPCLCCERAFCCSMVVMWPVLMQCWLMWCAPMWFDAVWLLVLCHVTWCNAMSCDVRSRVELSSVVPCNGMEPKMPLVLRSHCVFEVVIQSTILYYKALLCTAEYYSVLHSTTTCYSSTTLYYKAAFMIDVRRIWNVIYNARSNRSHPPMSRNTAPATQKDCDDWSASHMKRHLQWAEQQESQSIFTKYCTCHAKWMPSVIRVTYETSFPMREQVKSPFKLTNYCACHAKWISWLIRVAYETSFRMRGATRVTLHLHQILRLPRKMNLMIDPPHIWNVI